MHMCVSACVMAKGRYSKLSDVNDGISKEQLHQNIYKYFHLGEEFIRFIAAFALVSVGLTMFLNYFVFLF